MSVTDVFVLVLFVVGVASILAAAFGASLPRLALFPFGVALVAIAAGVAYGLPG